MKCKTSDKKRLLKFGIHLQLDEISESAEKHCNNDGDFNIVDIECCNNIIISDDDDDDEDDDSSKGDVVIVNMSTSSQVSDWEGTLFIDNVRPSHS